MDTASEAREQRDVLEHELKELKRSIELQRRLHLAAVAGGAQTQAADLQESIDSLLTRLGAVNAELALLTSVIVAGRL